MGLLSWLMGVRTQDSHDELAEQRAHLRSLIDERRAVELRNAIASQASRLDYLKSRGVPVAAATAGANGGTRHEQDPLFGWLDPHWLAPLDGLYGYGLPVSAFPREMFPERPTTLRQQIAQDAARLESRAWYETVPFYAGVIGHLRNYVVGSGMTFDCVALEDSDAPEDGEARREQDEGTPEAPPTEVEAAEQSSPNEGLAISIQEYLDGFATFRANRLHKRVWDSVLNIFRDGEDALRIFPPPPAALDGEPDVYPEIRSVDVSAIRGPHNEITGPWAYGMLTDWPRDFEAVKMYHIWYADNSHENVPPTALKLTRLDTVGANVKRGVPLSYKIRKALPQMVRLLDCMAVGEAARQAIPYIQQVNAADKAAVRGALTPSSLDYLDSEAAAYSAAEAAGERREIRPGDVPTINRGLEFVNPPAGAAEAGTAAYRTLAEACACALNVPLWFITGTADSENYASSLVSESPLTKTISHYQQIVTDHYREVCEAVVDIGAATGRFPLDWRQKVEVHCELPSPIARDPDKAVDSDLKLLDKGLLSPQHVCVRNGLDFDEEIDLTAQAEAAGWEKPQPIMPGLPGEEKPGGDGPPKPEE